MRAASFVGIALVSFFGAMVACGTFGEGTPAEGSPDATNGASDGPSNTDTDLGAPVDGAARADAKTDAGGSFCEDAGVVAACEDFDPPIEAKGSRPLPTGAR
jgi:hypothetical protein